MRAGTIVRLLILVLLLSACNRSGGSRFALDPGKNPNANTSRLSAVRPSNPAVMPVASYADTVSKATPAVVTIHSQTRVRQPQQLPFMDAPFLPRVFRG